MAQRSPGFSAPRYHKPLTPEAKYHFEDFHFPQSVAIILIVSITYTKLMQGLLD